MANVELHVPTSGGGLDWTRRAANAINTSLRRLAGLDTAARDLGERVDTVEMLLLELSARVDDKSGWANYRDGSAGQTLAANTRALWTNDAATVDDAEKPSDVPTYWDATNSLIPGHAGDAIVLRIQSTFTPSDGTASMLSMELDIGGMTLVDQQFIPITGGAGVAQSFSFTSLGFQRGVWEANGAKIYVMSDGPGVLTAKRILVARMHKMNAVD